MGVHERSRQKRIKQYVINRDGSLCCYCDQVLIDETITLEHIVPDSKHGTFNTTNLTISCRGCNNKRGNKPFFDYCKQFNFSLEKLYKYKLLYFNNLRIKVLNIAKEKCLIQNEAIPNELIKQACQILNIKKINFDAYEKEYNFEIKFSECSDRKKIKFTFEQLIRIIEADCE